MRAGWCQMVGVMRVGMESEGAPFKLLYCECIFHVIQNERCTSER